MHRDGRLSIPSALLLASWSLVAVAPPATAQGRGQARFVAVRTLDPADAGIAEFARQGAIARLRNLECSRILGDFTDGKGRPLLDNLAVFGVGPGEYLAMLPLLDGGTHSLCKANQSQLLTVAGVPRVFVCQSYLKAVFHERTMAEVYLIHEMLHTLGLGENPPSSQQITQQVVRRCAR